jgi:hypothetical protein
MSSSNHRLAGAEVPNQSALYVLRKLPHVTVLFWILKTLAVTLGETSGDLFALPDRHQRHAALLDRVRADRPLGAARSDYLVKPVDEGGLGWGTLWGSMALLALLIGFTIYQLTHLRRHPLEPLPAPVNHLIGEPERPNGAAHSST